MHATVTAPAGAYEYVYLVSDELEEVEPATVQAELEQSGGPLHRRVTIFNDTYLGVHIRMPGMPARWYWLNLAFLDPVPARPPDTPSLVTAACAALLAPAGLVLPGRGLAVSLLLAIALAFLGRAVYRGFGTLVFRTRHGRAPVLRLSRALPDRRRVRAFVCEMARAVQRGRAECGGDRGDYLRDEMKEHRRLVEQGALGPREFQRARALILAAHE